MDHAIRTQKIRREQKRKLTDAELEMVEKAAKPLVQKAVKDYGLGIANRGWGRQA
jgi:hypothetical protein